MASTLKHKKNLILHDDQQKTESTKFIFFFGTIKRCTRESSGRRRRRRHYNENRKHWRQQKILFWYFINSLLLFGGGVWRQQPAAWVNLETFFWFSFYSLLLQAAHSGSCVWFSCDNCRHTTPNWAAYLPFFRLLLMLCSLGPPIYISQLLINWEMRLS